MKITYFWKPILWLAIICYALFIPANDLPVKPLLKIPHFDKIVHFSLFFILCVFMFRPFKRLNFKYYFWAPFISVILASFLEMIQHSISISRNTDINDFLANVTGIFAAIIFFRYFISEKKWEILF